jgi:hypothetical protein
LAVSEAEERREVLRTWGRAAQLMDQMEAALAELRGLIADEQEGQAGEGPAADDA